MKIFDAMALHILQSLKSNYSNSACFSPVQFINNRSMTVNGDEKHSFVVVNIKLQVKIKFKMFC